MKRILVLIVISLVLLSFVSAETITIKKIEVGKPVIIGGEQKDKITGAIGDDSNDEEVCCKIEGGVPDAVPEYELMKKSKCSNVGESGEMFVGANYKIVDDSYCEEELNCGDYRYSNCPEGCLKNCVSSGTCSGDEDCFATADCEGEGSCYSPEDISSYQKECPVFTPPSPNFCSNGKIVIKKDENNCPLAPKCVTREQIKNVIKIKNKLKLQAQEGECPVNCTCTGSTTKCELEGGREMTIKAGNSGNIIFQVKSTEASTKVELYKSDGILYGVFKNNETKPVNFLPDDVQEKIKEKVKAKLEAQEIELDNEGIYKYQAKKSAKLFAVFPVKLKIRAEVDAETGEVKKLSKPWWAFLSKDVED